MAKVRCQISISLDGFVAGPGQSVDDPLGEGGMQLHEWAFELAAWRGPHGLDGGEVNASSAVAEEALDNVGASVMGRNMFGGGPGPWGAEPWNGWWGDDPPFHTPVFVLTHYERDPLKLEGGNELQLRHRGGREGGRAGAGGSRRQGRLGRRRRRDGPAVHRRGTARRAADPPRPDPAPRRRPPLRQPAARDRAGADPRRRGSRRHSPGLPPRRLSSVVVELARVVAVEDPVEGDVAHPFAARAGDQDEAADQMLAALVVAIEDVDRDRLGLAGEHL